MGFKKSCPTEMLPPLLLLISLVIQTSGLPYLLGYGGGYGGDYQIIRPPGNRAGGQYYEASNFYNPVNRAGLGEFYSQQGPNGFPQRPPPGTVNWAGWAESSGLGEPECTWGPCPGPPGPFSWTLA